MSSPIAIEAMKVLLADVASEAELGDRFIGEIRTLARLDHPNIAKFHTAFKVENQLVMVMEYVEGFTLSERSSKSLIPLDEVLSYITQTLSALSCAHQNGIIQRDIKPSNIMVTPHGVVKLMDFGIAKSAADPLLTRPGTTLGSMLYMSPEQVRGSNVDARSDLYSVGVLLYELTSGRRPFEAESTFAILDAQLNTPPRPPIEVNPSLPPALNEIVLMAMQKEPMRRLATADAFRNALETVRRSRGSGQSQTPQSNYAHTIVEPRIGSTPPTASPSFAQTVVESGLPRVSTNPPLASHPRHQTTVESVRPAATIVQPTAHAQPQPISLGSSPSNLRQQPSGHAPAVPARKGNRGLWMAAGAVACVCIIAGAAQFFRASASGDDNSAAGKSGPAVTPTTVPDPKPLPPAGPGVAPATRALPPQPAANVHTVASAKVVALRSHTPAAPISPPVATKPTPTMPAASSVPDNVTAPPVSLPPERATDKPLFSAEEIDKANDDMIKLRARADAVRGSLNNLRSQQAASGVGLRQDMVASASRMDSYLQAADRALRGNRLDAARKNMDKAGEEISRLEAFFGR